MSLELHPAQRRVFSCTLTPPMPAIPLKERWWKTRAKPDPRGDWLCLETDKFSFETAWCKQGHDLPISAELKPESGEIMPYEDWALDQLGGCAHCNVWDAQQATKPLDVLFKPTRKSNNTIASHHYQAMWIAPLSVIRMSVVHRRVIDALRPYFDDDILIGDVIVQGGDQIHDLACVVDRGTLQGRNRYRPSWFKRSSSQRWRPCPYCGCLGREHYWTPTYIYTPDYLNRSPRVYQGQLLVPPEIANEHAFIDRDSWPTLKHFKVPEFSCQLDPLPSPIPGSWDELEAFFVDRGHAFPKVRFCSVDESQTWLAERAERIGKDHCLIDVSDIAGRVNAEALANYLFMLRFRSLIEPKVAERIDHWTDHEVMRFVTEYIDASGITGSYFPI